MKKITLLFSLLLTAFTYAQVDYLNHEISSTDIVSGSVDSMLELDVDEDGDLDIVYGTNSSYGRIGWYENLDSQGSFGHINILEDSEWAVTSLILADIDNDGDKDIIATTYNNGTIIMFENLEGPSFAIKQIIYEGISYPKKIFSIDIDGDSYLDLIAAHSGDTISWLKNIDGNGTFEDPIIINTSMTNISSIYAADMDSDNDIDIIANKSSSIDDYSKLFWFENLDGLGNFNSAGEELYHFDTEPNYSIVSEVHLADIDNDSDQDIIFAINNKAAWLENVDGQGNFTSEHLIIQIGNRQRFIKLDIKDLNNDGDLDIASASTEYQAYDKVRIHDNEDGLGDLNNFQLIDDNGNNLSEIQIADFNGDGLQDIILGARSSPFITWHKRIDLNSFEPSKEITPYVYYPMYHLATDIDNDNDLDILVNINNTIVKYENKNGAGDFGYQEVIGYTYGAERIYTKDLNGDGTEDLISVYGASSQGVIEWYPNDGQGNFGPQTLISNTSFSNLAIGDIDGDLDNDIVFYRNNNNSASFGYIINTDGQGTFAPFVLFTNMVNSSGVRHVELLDIDSDGDLDILYSIGDNDYGRLAWFENTDGLGNFGPEIIIHSDPTYQTIGIDMDNDKIPYIFNN
jgi:hypothetical protein